MLVPKLILLGAPGVGKGTYSKIISKTLKLPIIAVGDLVRNEICSETPVGKQMKEYSNTGKLVPDKLIFDLVKSGLNGVEETQSGYIMDGYPRTIVQAQQLEGVSPPNKVISLTMRRVDLVTKLLGRRICTRSGCGKSYNVAHALDVDYGVDMPPLPPKNGDPSKCDCGAELGRRDDDTEDIINNRLLVYENETFPLVDYYKSQNLLQTFEIKKGLNDLPQILELIVGKYIPQILC
eukprot:CAMPEP_0204831498 /NCGR_PEP_ID=MMETSP1346-20131115/10817_1 /ASSEMBLY_ACC=CAM_ASM_000771 /TAXON_ID=215587 /ORGANISM="Aplanochytrium stocchinoi, Strain GSBS06" /LENGTH=235 /DNA_ID=CAMNT_0051962587 /DNA_START=149 /DNA_END=856 /DNA_ORIENTATION=+